MGHSQLARSLERILEEAHFSGELILTNRKLKDFPKTGTKFNLTDTVIADLSRNRFCELPEEITSFAFLETLLLYHNTIRSIPESVKQLTSLTYLDLRSNQLAALPREICFLPLQVLLVSNNRLATLPDELGRMDRLTDLDASYNQLTALPARIGELRSLRSFSLRSNQLMYLPRELTCLNLVSLDVSNNRIASLPLEIRQMTTLVEFNLENNPLTLPPASLCVRGLVHVFKFLETQATKDERGSRAGGNYDGYTTLRRAPRHNSAGNMLDATATTPRTRHHMDTGYSICDGLDKRWSHDVPVKPSAAKLSDSPIRRPTPTMTPPTHSLSAELMDASLTSSTSTIVDESISLTGSPALVKPLQYGGCESPAPSPVKHLNYAHSTSSSNGSSPDQDDMMIDHQERSVHCNGSGGKVGDEKLNKSLSNIQTYKEYKEALKQQRNQEITNVYKAKHTGGNANLSPNDCAEEQLQRLNGAIAAVQTSTLPKSIMKQTNHSNGHNVGAGMTTNGNSGDDVVIPKKPIQKVIPSRNTELMASQATKMQQNTDLQTNGDCLGYVKPNSPMKVANGGGGSGGSSGVLTSSNNNKLNGGGGGGSVNNMPTGTIKSPVGATTKLGTIKTHRTVTWNHDIPSEKLSFTMRREFDRQREEIELMTQLRSIIETRLKMTLPEDIASALTDGVILCHLANYVRPRSVASIHVPSPGVSKLTMARCRRNVDNFLEACRRIGVDEELICSCADVVPQVDDDDHGDNDVEGGGGQEHVENDDYINSNNNYANDNAKPVVHNKRKSKRNLPNILAVLKTVAALIALDTNPHHQSIRYVQQQQELQRRLQQHQQQQQQEQQFNQGHKQDENVYKQQQQQQQHSLQYENMNKNEVDMHNFGHEQFTAPTCTKQQQQMQQEQQQQQQPQLQQNNYEIVTKMEIENTSDNFHTKTYFENIITTTNSHHDIDNDVKHDGFEQAAYVADDDDNVGNVGANESRINKNTVTQLIRTAKLKTFQKIKLNLLTSHGHHSFNNNNNRSRCGETTTTTLHTIVESEHDVVAAGPAGHYHVINEKTIEDELPLYANVKTAPSNKSTNAQEPPLEQQQQQEQSQQSMPLKDANGGANVSKRIEFFEHNKTGANAKPKVATKPSVGGIFSIYRINSAVGGHGQLGNSSEGKPLEQAQLCAMMLKSKEKEQEAGSSLLKHDSHTLTIILSCVFIVTFLLLVFFPLPG